MKHLFIINPAAGKGKSLNVVPEIHRIFFGTDEEYIIEITKVPGHATEIAKKYSDSGDYRIYSIGGDGTLNEVLNGMAGSNSSLGVIPAGSGNDFIRSISDSGVDDIVRRVINGKDLLIDLGRVNGKYFINISSVGIDAEVAYNALQLKKFPMISGSMAYLLSIFKTVFKYKSKYLYLVVDSKDVSKDTLLFAVANGVYYGGGMKIAPKASLHDGTFDICHVRNLSKSKILRLFPKVIHGEHEEIEEVSFLKGQKIALSCREEFTLNIDGELTRTKEADFEIIPKGIKIIIPE